MFAAKPVFGAGCRAAAIFAGSQRLHVAEPREKVPPILPDKNREIPVHRAALFKIAGAVLHDDLSGQARPHAGQTLYVCLIVFFILTPYLSSIDTSTCAIFPLARLSGINTCPQEGQRMTSVLKEWSR